MTKRINLGTLLIMQFIVFFAIAEYFINKLLLLTIYHVGLPVTTTPTILSMILAMLAILIINKRRLNEEWYDKE